MNHGQKVALTAVAAAVLCATSAAWISYDDPVVRVPIPPGFDFPAPADRLQRARDSNDETALRMHAWSVFEGLSQPTGDGRLVWETWESTKEMFETDKQAGRDALALASAVQLELAAEPSAAALGDCSNDGFTSGLVITSVRLDPAAAQHILKRQYTDEKEFARLIDGGQLVIEEFPRDAVAVKAIWWPIRPSELTPLPIWTGPTARPGTGDQGCRGNNFLRWKTIFAIDPNPGVYRAPPDRALVLSWDPGKDFPLESRSTIEHPTIVPITSFHVRRITDDEIQRKDLVVAFNRVVGRDPEKGDLVALVGLHFSTKELPDWIWATTWWSGINSDPDQPAPLRDHPIWKNFQLSVVAAIGRPASAPQMIAPIFAFNPWLEAPLRRGTQSNCMECHQKAVWKSGEGNPHVSVPEPGEFRKLTPNDDLYESGLRLDYLWSLRVRR